MYDSESEKGFSSSSSSAPTEDLESSSPNNNSYDRTLNESLRFETFETGRVFVVTFEMLSCRGRRPKGERVGILHEIFFEGRQGRKESFVRLLVLLVACYGVVRYCIDDDSHFLSSALACHDSSRSLKKKPLELIVPIHK